LPFWDKAGDFGFLNKCGGEPHLIQVGGFVKGFRGHNFAASFSLPLDKRASMPKEISSSHPCGVLYIFINASIIMQI